MDFIASSAFSLEGIVKKELAGLGINASGEQGGARFTSDMAGAFKANLWLACADRVLLILREGKVYSFQELFDFVHAVNWEDYLPQDASFPVSGNCVRSKLMSVSDCQSITKKAIVERLRQKYRTDWFAENGSKHQVSITIHNDTARLTLDTSGEALNRRGYRTWVGEAPIRETLAAALVRLSPWLPGQTICDPCCGTGTLLIEAAFLASHRAPGLKRPFAMENWKITDQAVCRAIRNEAQKRYSPKNIRGIHGSDIDPEALELCEKHLTQAGLSGQVQVRRMDLRDVRLSDQGPCFLTNPPYGERLGDRKKSAVIAAALGEMQKKHPGSVLCAITADPAFEQHAKSRAVSRRRLYNGRLECEFLVLRG